MSIVNPYEPSQLQATALPAFAEPELSSEREQRIFGTRGTMLAQGARNWLLGLAVHHGFALVGYLLYVADWSLGQRTAYRHLGFAVLLIGIVISLFIQAAGQLELCRWPPSDGTRWWFRAAFLCLVGVMVLGIGDLMLTLKYRENRALALGELIDLERPVLLGASVALNLMLALSLFHVGRLLEDRRLWLAAAIAFTGGLLLGVWQFQFELLGNITQVLREITFLDQPEQATVILAWLLMTVPLVVAMFRLYKIARRVAAVTIPVAIDDPLAD